MGVKPLPTVKTPMSRIIGYQFLIILGFVLLIGGLKGTPSGISAFAGALCYWLPTVVFIKCVSALASVRAGIGFIAVFMAGEGIKLLLCGVLFVIFINYFQVQPIDAVIGIAGAIVAFWLAAALSLLTKKEVKS